MKTPTELFEAYSEATSRESALKIIAQQGFTHENELATAGLPAAAAAAKLAAALKAATSPAPSQEKLRELGEAMSAFRKQSKFTQ